MHNDQDGWDEWNHRKKIILKFAEAIQHGDEEHRKWLMEAANAYADGKPLPPSRHNDGIDK